MSLNKVIVTLAALAFCQWARADVNMAVAENSLMAFDGTEIPQTQAQADEMQLLYSVAYEDLNHGGGGGGGGGHFGGGGGGGHIGGGGFGGGSHFGGGGGGGHFGGGTHTGGGSHIGSGTHTGGSHIGSGTHTGGSHIGSGTHTGGSHIGSGTHTGGSHIGSGTHTGGSHIGGNIGDHGHHGGGSGVVVEPVPVPVPTDSVVAVRCMSEGPEQTFCPVNGAVVSVALEVQLSADPCISSQTFGAQPNGIWVAQGCSGDFLVHVE